MSDPAPSLLTDRRLGVYHFHERIGGGGMGEVYRARDMRLARDVAVKILPRAFTADADRLARFDREAHALAALNHPNIATIHGVEDSEGIPALVMELVPGNTLAERLTAGAMPVPEAFAGWTSDRRRARRRPREGDRPPGSEALQYQDHIDRPCEGPGLRPGQGGTERRRRGGSRRVHNDRGCDMQGADRRYGRLHESGAGARPAHRQAHRHLGVRVRPLRDAYGPRQGGRTAKCEEFLLCHTPDAYVFAIPLGDEAEPILVRKPPAGFIDQPQFSPDGRCIAYNADESGEHEVYITAFPPTGTRVKVSQGGGVQPVWRQDGRELYYLGLDSVLKAVELRTGGRPVFSVPKALFDTGLVAPSPWVEQYTVSADGQRVLVLEPVETTVRNRIGVILNWPALLDNARTP